MVNEIGGGGIVLNKSNIVLVFQKTTRTWGFPKGHVERGESLEETARREIYEETGIENLVLIKKLGSYVRGNKKNPDLEKEITMFGYVTTQSKLKPIEQNGLIAKWVSINRVADMLSYKKDREFFLRIRNQLEY